MNQVIYANTHDSDMFYKVKMNIPDKFFYFNINGDEYIFLDHREYGVFKKQNKDSDINLVLLNPLIEEANKLSINGNETEKLAYFLFKKYNLLDKEVNVSDNFPLSLADFLRKNGVNIKAINPLLPEREIKNNKEIIAIRNSIKNTEKAYDLIVNILQESIIKGEQIFFKNKILTSEFLKQEIEKLLLEKGMIFPEGMIVASGEQTAIPHDIGSGEIKPNVPIICDIFPMDRRTGYYADMTRTFVKGEPSKDFVNMYNAVQEAQAEAVKIVAPHKNSREIHQVVIDIFQKLNYDVGNKGFIHGTGHSFGLDIHEAPYINKFFNKELKPGNIITIEPGLYYKGIGGVRIEDDILVTKDGYENLCTYTRDLQIL